MNKLGFIVGNGTSRLAYDLEQLRGHGTIVGCNWLYRDFEPDVIVALDKDPVAVIEAIEDRKFKFLTRNRKYNIMLLDGQDMGWKYEDVNRRRSFDSGIVGASYLAKIEKCKHVIMFGIDFYRGNPHDRKAPNDVYSGRIRRGTRQEAWNILFRDCPNTQFTRIGKIEEWDFDFYSNKIQGLKYKEAFNASDFI